MVVELIKRAKNAVTLAIGEIEEIKKSNENSIIVFPIGDGANDVSMIKGLYSHYKKNRRHYCGK